MKNWKKVLAVSMAAMVMAGALAGCGDDKKEAVPSRLQDRP